MPKLSIALATRNGARYLPELLDSLATQTLPPFEIVACDDASTDTTRRLLDDFARLVPFAVHIHASACPLGIVGNFENAIGRCNGEIIALADQDDVWRADKLEQVAMALHASEAQVTFSDASVVDATLLPLGYTMWQRVRFTPEEQQRFASGGSFSVLLKHHVVTGATLAFKPCLRDVALPIPPGWPHDAWLATVAAAKDRHCLVAIGEPLIAYRQHAANAVGGMRKSLSREVCAALRIDRSAWYRDELLLWQALASRLETWCLPVPWELDEKIAHLKRRASLPAARWRRVPGVLHELANGGYTSYARNWGSAAIDLFVK